MSSTPLACARLHDAWLLRALEAIVRRPYRCLPPDCRCNCTGVSKTVVRAGRRSATAGACSVANRFVCGEQLRRFMPPLELVFDAATAERAHCRAPRRIGEQ